jgi:hypothetical protein
MRHMRRPNFAPAPAYPIPPIAERKHAAMSRVSARVFNEFQNYYHRSIDCWFVQIGVI